MKNQSTNHQEWLVQELADPELAALYLTSALEDSPEMFLEAVKNVAQAKHKISALAKQAGITRESVYRSFSSDGNPAFKTFHKLLDILDIEIEFKAKGSKPESDTIASRSEIREGSQSGVLIGVAPKEYPLGMYTADLGSNTQQSVYALDTNINSANSAYIGSHIDNGSMGIATDVFMSAFMRQQQQIRKTEEINAER
jgi:probable addiction module antidote protein